MSIGDYVREVAGTGADLDPELEAAGVESWSKADPDPPSCDCCAREGEFHKMSCDDPRRDAAGRFTPGGPDLTRVREYRAGYHRGMKLVAEAEEELGARTTDARAAEAARAEAAAKVERLRGWANAQAQTAAWELDKILGV